MAKNVTWLKNLESDYERDVVRELKALGHDAVMYSYIKSSFKNRTYNLYNSYASAVYVRGALVPSSIQFLGSPMSVKKDKKTGKTGRQTAKDYLYSHSFGAASGEIVLVVIAAMYYAGILEAGGEKRVVTKIKDENGKVIKRTSKRSVANKGPGSRYKVISPAKDYISQRIGEVISRVNEKYGISKMPKTRVIKGEKL